MRSDRRTARTLVRTGLLVGSLAASLGAATVAQASGPEGVWNREDGLGGVRIAPCGPSLCGHVVWLREANGPAFIGEKVLYGMRQTAADTWSGSAHNPEDGRDYAGTMTLDGDRLMTRGCVFGGLICRSVALTRAR